MQTDSGDRLSQDIETLKKKNELLTLQNRVHTDLCDRLSKDLAVLNENSLKKETDLIKYIEENENLMENRVSLEEQNNLINKEKEILVQENEKYRNLNCELEKEAKDLEIKMEKNHLNIEILHHRNYETEVKLSKTRKYIKHSSREQNHRLQNLHQELSNWNHDYNGLEKDFVEINGRSQFLENMFKY